MKYCAGALQGVRMASTVGHLIAAKGLQSIDWVSLKTLPMARELTGIVNAFVMVGEGLGTSLPAIRRW